MPITFSCPSCTSNFTVNDLMAGKRIDCLECRNRIVVPAAGTLYAAVSLAEHDTTSQHTEEEPRMKTVTRTVPPPLPATDPISMLLRWASRFPTWQVVAGLLCVVIVMAAVKQRTGSVFIWR